MIQAHPRLRINDATLVVGVDIAKHHHVAVAQVPDGRISKPLTFANTREGFTQFQQWLQHEQTRSQSTAAVMGMEPTGQYWQPLAEWLQREGHTIHLGSPFFTKRAKELVDGSPLKTDAKDAWVIADLTRQGKGRLLGSQPTLFQELRHLASLRRRLVVARGVTLNQLHRVLDTLFPELTGVFKSFDGATFQALLRTAPTPAEVVALGLEGLTQLFKQHSRQRLGQRKALALLTVARQSIACQQGVQALRLELSLLLPRLTALNLDVAKVEAQMGDRVDQVAYTPLLLSIPGLGRVTTAIILGELGDLRNYHHANQVLKMAGLNLFERSSGTQHGRQHVSKRGRSQLRQILYMSAVRFTQRGGPLRGLLEKFKPHKPGPKVMVIGMRRLLRMMFALVRDEQTFQQAQFEVRPAMARVAT